MPSTLHILTGPARCGKTRRLLDSYRARLATAPPGSMLWLAPTSRSATEIRNDLLDGNMPGCFAPGISTFARFTEGLLLASPEPVRPLSPMLKRHLIRQLIDEEHKAGRLRHFGPIAQTTGMLDLVCDFIRELKRLEIWPAHLAEACEGRGTTEKDRELLAIYRAYQKQLEDHQLYDAEGKFWLARNYLRSDRSQNSRSMVVADGFSDFTKTEHDILALLAAQSDEIWISLPLEPEPRRRDLFHKPLTTLAELQRRHANVRFEEVARPSPSTWPAMAHLERMLFTNPRTMQPAADTSGLEILAGGRTLGELELIGHRIKRLLLEGDGTLGGKPVPPGQVAVVFRSPQPAADLIGEVFQRLGIPFYLECGKPMSRSPVVLLLVRLLELDADDWPMHTLLAVLGNNYFAPQGDAWRHGTTTALAERTIRKQQIPRGRERLLLRLSQGEPTPDVVVVSALLSELADALDELPQHGTLAEFALAWQRLAQRLGIVSQMQGRADQRAWEQLHATVREIQQLAGWLGQDAPQLDRNQARSTLADILAGLTPETTNEEAGRVRILSAASVRHLRIPYLFVVGLSEKSFPKAEREDRLYGESEYRQLVEAGLPLPTRSDRQTDEMLLFYEALTSAARRLYLSYPAIDESGQPLTPSPYLKEVEQACGATKIARTERLDRSPVPSEDEVLSPVAFRVRAVAQAMSGKAESLAGLAQFDGPFSERLYAGLAFSLERQHRDRFVAAEGMLSKEVGNALQGDFAKDRIFSATELEGYAYCPYQFFMSRVLKIEPLEELELEVDYMQRGLMAHELLASLHRRVNQAHGGRQSPTELAEDDYQKLLAETIEKTLSKPPRDSLADAMREIDRRMLLQWIAEYRTQHVEYDAHWSKCREPLRPELFEISFGRKLREGDGPPSTDVPLEIESHGQVVRLSGRIDRIDVGQVEGTPVFNILDYKTGASARFSVDAVARGTVLQLPLYALAAAELILNDRDALPWQAGYWYLAEGGFKPRQALKMYEVTDGHLTPTQTWEELRQTVADTVVGLVHGMRQGQFPVWSDDPDCTGRCPFKTVCRINQVRSLEKKWQPPRP